VKLVRVAMLVPLVAAGGRRGLPLFLVGFLVAVAGLRHAP
jgi:hypothetical protein